MAGDFLEGDLLRYYGVSLYDVVAGKLPPRHVLALLRSLPPESRSFAIIRAYAEDNAPKRPPSTPDPLFRYMGWDPVNHWLAIIAEQLTFYRWEYARAHGEKRVKAPEPLDMPGRTVGRQRKPSSLYALARAAAGLD